MKQILVYISVMILQIKLLFTNTKDQSFITGPYYITDFLIKYFHLTGIDIPD
jgi:hypothetical protein